MNIRLMQLQISIMQIKDVFLLLWNIFKKKSLKENNETKFSMGKKTCGKSIR